MRLMRYLLYTLLGIILGPGSSAHAAEGSQNNLVPGGGAAAAASRAEPVRFQAILVIASDSGESDRSLSAYEQTLKRMLRFKSYRRAGEGTATVAAGGETTVTLGRGHKADLWVTSATEDEVVFGVRWFNAQQTLANTKVTRPRRSHTVVGGAAVEDGDGRYAVIVTTE